MKKQSLLVLSLSGLISLNYALAVEPDLGNNRVTIFGEIESLNETGIIVKEDETNRRIVLNASKKIIDNIKGTEKEHSGLDGLINRSKGLYGYKTLLRFQTEIDSSTGQVSIQEMPTAFSGKLQVTGKLEKTESNGLYTITKENGESVSVSIQEGQPVNNFSFDQLSIEHFLNNQVTARVRKVNGKLQVSSLVPGSLYSAKESSHVSPLGLHAQIKTDGKKYVKKELQTNDHSKSENSFRYTLIEAEDYQPEKGEIGLLITLSGRQGEDYGAAGGHFAIGGFTVNEDLSWDAEIFNFYGGFSEKQIIPGHVSIEDYYGHVVMGQNNYRPTYTLALYGISKKDLKTVREFMDQSLNFMRDNPEIVSSLEYNCTTESVLALKEIRLVNSAEQSLLGGYGRLRRAITGNIDKTFNALRYSFFTPMAFFTPRNTFMSYLKNMEKMVKRLGIKRVDAIFQAQTRSARPLGGTACNGRFECKGVANDLASEEKELEVKTDPQVKSQIMDEKIE